MKTESDHTQEIIKRLREDLPVTVLKHCDRFTVGIPDMSVTNPDNDKTIWIENKKLGKSSQKLLCANHWIDNAAQLMMTASLNGYYLVLDNFRGDAIFMRARRVLRFYRERELIHPAAGEYLYHVGFDLVYENLKHFLKGALNV